MVGVSLSAEIGYQRREYSADTWTLELRPIVDKQWGRWYFALNPTLERALRGPGTSLGPQPRRPHRPDPQHRPPDRQDDPGPPLRHRPRADGAGEVV